MEISREVSNELNSLRLGLIRAGYIESVTSHQFAANRLVCVRCGDGRHTADHHNHLRALLGGNEDGAIHHLLASNGGPIFLGPMFPMARKLRLSFGSGNWGVIKAILNNLAPSRLVPKLIARLHGLLQLKQSLAIFQSSDVRTISLTTHFPCGAAALCGYSFEDQLWCLVKAKELLKRIFGNKVKVVCFVHFAVVDQYDAEGNAVHTKKRTYKLNTQAAAKWLQSGEPLPASQPPAEELQVVSPAA